MTIAEIIAANNASFESAEVCGVSVSLRVDGRRAVLSMPVGYLGDDPNLGYDDESEEVFTVVKADLSAFGFAFHDSGVEEDGSGEYHVFLRDITTITVDYENDADLWWTAARAAIDTAPTALRPMLLPGGPDEIVVGEIEADAIRVWVASIPGWRSADASAPYPLVIAD